VSKPFWSANNALWTKLLRLNPVYTIEPVVNPVVQLVWQPAVSCKRGLRSSERLVG